MDDKLLKTLQAWRQAEIDDALDHLIGVSGDSGAADRLLHEIRKLVDRATPNKASAGGQCPGCKEKLFCAMCGTAISGE